MPSTSFTCPECDTGLRGAENIPAGTKVRCPSCSAVFLMPEWKGVASSQAIRDTPMSSSAPSRPSHEGGVNEPAPRSKRRSRDDEDAELPRRRSRPDEDETVRDEFVEEESRDDEDIEDRPRKKRRKKKKSQKSGAGLLIGVIAGSIAAVAGIGLLLWLFLFSRGEDPLAYIPADFDLISGADDAAFTNDPTLGSAFKKLAKAGSPDIFNGMKSGNVLGEGDIEFSITALKLGDGLGGNNAQPPMIIVTKFKKPFDKKLSAKNLKNATPAQMSGKEYYQLNDPTIK